MSAAIELSRMKGILADIYDSRPGWIAKLNAMSTAQVLAVYQRFASVNFDVAAFKGKKILPPSHTRDRLQRAATPDRRTTYLCTECKGWFMADNPELQECRYCGSPHIIKGGFYED